ncbi:hypothetical protein NC652_014511 [Populus alba x Populus x berolinensis]|nr:hypothetical protein NC652_014511 [Populus alba x Populus x berolinensis]
MLLELFTRLIVIRTLLWLFCIASVYLMHHCLQTGNHYLFPYMLKVNSLDKYIKEEKKKKKKRVGGLSPWVAESSTP